MIRRVALVSSLWLASMAELGHAQAIEAFEQNADRYSHEGRLADALSAYREALRHASTPEDGARVAYKLAQTARLRSAMLTEHDRERLRVDAIDAYEKASTSSDPMLRAAALRGQADFLVETGDSQRAVQRYRELIATDTAGAETGKYALGYAAALERNSEPQKAYAQYREALIADSKPAAAIEGAFRTLSPEIGSQDALAELLKLAVAKTEVRAAKKGLRLVMERSSDRAFQLKTVIALGTLLGTAQSAELTTQDVEWLKQAKAEAPDIAACFDEIERIQTSTLPALPADLAAIQTSFPCWTADAERTSTLSKMLFARGARLSNTDRAAALRFLVSAWLSEPASLEAAADAAALLASEPPLLVTEPGALPLVQAALAPEKSGAAASAPASTRVRGLTSLADVYASTKHWPMAIELLRSALAIEAAQLASNPAHQRLPGLHVKLAEAYAEDGNTRGARDRFFTAASHFATLKNRPRAEDALRKAQALPLPLTDEDRARVQGLEQVISAIVE